MAKVMNMPRLGLSEDESIIGKWFVAQGDKVKGGDELFSIETDKSSMSVYAENEGVVLKRFYDDFDVVKVMTPVCVIGEEGEDISYIKAANEINKIAVPKEATKKKEIIREEIIVARVEDEVFISPRAKKTAAANGVDTRGIYPTGAEGRIIEEDIINTMKTIAPTQWVQPSTPSEGVHVVKMSSIRKAISKNMKASLQNTAQLTSHGRYNASVMLKYKEWYKTSPGEEKNITITDMILFAVTKTLQQFDYMNAHLMDDEEIHMFDAVNLGCAVDTPKGLMVPTIKNAQDMSIIKLSQTIKQLAKKCKEGTITSEEMKGATFTVSNLGTFGVVNFTPIINPPQVGIIGVGTIDYAIKKTNEGMLYYPAGNISLTYDHRAVDGAPSSKFLQAVCSNLENLDKLL